MYLALFLIFGALCVAGALNLLLQRHPINSALSLIVVMTSLGGLLTYVFLSNSNRLGRARLGDYLVTTSDLSRVLFRDLLLPFEVTSVLILVAILGAVALARKEE